MTESARISCRPCRSTLPPTDSGHAVVSRDRVFRAGWFCVSSMSWLFCRGLVHRQQLSEMLSHVGLSNLVQLPGCRIVIGDATNVRNIGRGVDRFVGANGRYFVEERSTSKRFSSQPIPAVNFSGPSVSDFAPTQFLWKKVALTAIVLTIQSGR